MKAFVTTAVAAALLLTTGSASHGQPVADPPCAGQIHPNPGFERGATGWSAGPRIVVFGDATRPAHTGRGYATFAGLDACRISGRMITTPPASVVQSRSGVVATTRSTSIGGTTVSFWPCRIRPEAGQGARKLKS